MGLVHSTEIQMFEGFILREILPKSLVNFVVNNNLELGEEMDHRWIEFISLNGKFYTTFEDKEHTDEEIQREVESLLDYKVFGMTSLYDDNITDEDKEDFELKIVPWLHLDIEK